MRPDRAPPQVPAGQFADDERMAEHFSGVQQAGEARFTLPEVLHPDRGVGQNRSAAATSRNPAQARLAAAQRGEPLGRRLRDQGFQTHAHQRRLLGDAGQRGAINAAPA